MKKTVFYKLFITLGLISIFGSFISCSQKEQNKSASHKEKQIVRVANYNGYVVPYDIGIDTGIIDRVLKENGFDNIELKIINFSKGAEAVEAAQAGELDFVTSGDQMVTTAILQNGLPFKIVGVNYLNTKLKFVASSKSGIKTPADIKNTRVGALLGNNQYLLILSFIEAQGYKLNSDVEFINLSIADQFTALATNQIDWTLLFATQEKKYFELDKDAVVLGTIGDYKFNECVISVSDKFGKENPKLTATLLKAFDEATRYANEHIDEQIKVTLKHYEGDEETARVRINSCEYQVPLNEKILNSIQQTLHYSYVNGLISKEADVSEVVDISYLKEAGLYK